MLIFFNIFTPQKNKINMQHFKELLTPIYNDFYKFIYSIVRNKALADDAVQNALLSACKNINELRELDKFKSWLFSIGKREALRILKTYSREVSTDFSVLELVSSRKYNPEEIIIKEENKRRVIQIINELREDYRDLILLRYYAGLSFEEIADVLNMNYNTIRSNHMRAKNILLSKLQNEYVDEGVLAHEK